MSDDQTPPKSGQFARKKLTPFLAHEMIYDYATGQLDPERRAALEEFMAKDHESQNLLKNIEAAQAYTAKLSKTTIDSEVLQHLSEAENAVSLGRKYSSWREWPETLRWSITAIALSAGVAGVVALVPWSKLSSSRKTGGVESLEVAQIAQPKTDEIVEVAANDDNGSGDEAPTDVTNKATGEDSGDDVADEGDGGGGALAKTSALAVAPKPTPVLVVRATPPAALGRLTPTPFVSVNLPPNNPSGAKVPAPIPALGTNASTRIMISETADTHAAGDTKAKGFVFRAFMTLDNLDEIAPKIKDDIIALGGEKSGEVELGWKRGSGHYYHFAIPEDNEKKMLERLQVYGPVRISKDPHPRVMPPGKVRFILWVESAPES